MEAESSSSLIDKALGWKGDRRNQSGAIEVPCQGKAIMTGDNREAALASENARPRAASRKKDLAVLGDKSNTLYVSHTLLPLQGLAGSPGGRTSSYSRS